MDKSALPSGEVSAGGLVDEFEQLLSRLDVLGLSMPAIHLSHALEALRAELGLPAHSTEDERGN